ncbi:hypothetical protein, partial [Bacteroides thetaiotaomicron]|uniref:hypothetical protein n=1 Tax=Bacteroides thetaiotaomicron TaxID=818 RepID=UPI00374EACF4
MATTESPNAKATPTVPTPAPTVPAILPAKTALTTLKGWRGERINAQAVVWTGT